MARDDRGTSLLGVRQEPRELCTRISGAALLDLAQGRSPYRPHGGSSTCASPAPSRGTYGEHERGIMSEAFTGGPPASTVEPGMERVFTRSPVLGTNTHSLCPGCGEPNAVRVLMESIEEMGERENTVCVLGIGC